jgi:hypothetical protein
MLLLHGLVGAEKMEGVYEKVALVFVYNVQHVQRWYWP